MWKTTEESLLKFGVVTWIVGISLTLFEIKTLLFLANVISFLALLLKSTNVVVVTPPNNVHMLWLLPQYAVMNVGAIMFSITGLEFAYSQAPTSMKTVIMAGWLLTTSIGNLIVVIIEAIGTFQKPSYNFFLYACLLLIDMAVLILMAMKYKYVDLGKTKLNEK